jgi:hypothetical protein
MQCASALRTLLIVVPIALLLAASPVAAQQTYVSQFDAFAGYAFLDSPHISLFENGFQAQFGYRPKPWYSLGFDYSRSTGDLVLTPDLLPTALQQQLRSELAQMIAAHLIPAGYALAVSTHSTTQTFAHRPAACLSPLFAPDAVRPAIARGHPRSRRPAPRGCHRHFHRGATGANREEDGLDWILWIRRRLRHPFSKHFALRTQADLVYDHLFNDLLKDGRWTVRFSVGPCFNFGRNIAKLASGFIGYEDGLPDRRNGVSGKPLHSKSSFNRGV